MHHQGRGLRQAQRSADVRAPLPPTPEPTRAAPISATSTSAAAAPSPGGSPSGAAPPWRWGSRRSRSRRAGGGGSAKGAILEQPAARGRGPRARGRLDRHDRPGLETPGGRADGEAGPVRAFPALPGQNSDISTPALPSLRQMARYRHGGLPLTFTGLVRTVRITVFVFDWGSRCRCPASWWRIPPSRWTSTYSTTCSPIATSASTARRWRRSRGSRPAAATTTTATSRAASPNRASSSPIAPPTTSGCGRTSRAWRRGCRAPCSSP